MPRLSILHHSPLLRPSPPFRRRGALRSPLAMAAWSRDDDKAFEVALALALPFSDEKDENKKWEEIAKKVPGKNAEEVRVHYEALMEDLEAIEGGRVALPLYVEREKERERENNCGVEKKGSGLFDAGKSVSKAEQERRKGIPWTEEEHK